MIYLVIQRCPIAPNFYHILEAFNNEEHARAFIRDYNRASRYLSMPADAEIITQGVL